MPGGLTLLASANADIPNPASGKVTIFFSLTSGVPSYKDSAGTVLPLGTTGATGATGSVGPAGPAIPFLFEPIQGEDGIPGPPGVSGSGSGSGALTLIQEQLLGSDVASVTFSAIPGTYRHLKLVIYGRSTEATTNNFIYLQFNGDTGANYDYQQSIIVNTALAAANAYAQTKIALGQIAGASAPTAGMVGACEILIPLYAGTTYNKILQTCCSAIIGTSGSNTQVGQFSGQWRSTAAITSIVILLAANDFKTGSILSLYGML